MTLNEVRQFYDNYDPQSLTTTEAMDAMMGYVADAFNGNAVEGLMDVLASAKVAVGGDELARNIKGVIPDL